MTAAGTGERKRRVLVVDDERAIAAVLRLALEDAGFEVDEAYASDDALALAVQRRPDVILVDLLLGDDAGDTSAGEALSLALRARGLETPIIIVSALRRAVDVAEQLGVGFLAKPFDLDDLIARVEAALAGGEPAAAD